MPTFKTRIVLTQDDAVKLDESFEVKGAPETAAKLLAFVEGAIAAMNEDEPLFNDNFLFSLRDLKFQCQDMIPCSIIFFT